LQDAVAKVSWTIDREIPWTDGQSIKVSTFTNYRMAAQNTNVIENRNSGRNWPLAK